MIRAALRTTRAAPARGGGSDFAPALGGGSGAKRVASDLRRFARETGFGLMLAGARPMTRDPPYLYDTTLRDGQQTQGVQFSTAEKHQIAAMLDQLGIDYIEGGWPGANPTDSDFFATPPATRATLTAFGMTKRAGRSAENDDVLAAVLNAGKIGLPCRQDA